jgi:hypothetical protein
LAENNDVLYLVTLQSQTIVELEGEVLVEQYFHETSTAGGK